MYRCEIAVLPEKNGIYVKYKSTVAEKRITEAQTADFRQYLCKLASFCLTDHFSCSNLVFSQESYYETNRKLRLFMG